jgi:hypothetical protein
MKSPLQGALFVFALTEDESPSLTPPVPPPASPAMAVAPVELDPYVLQTVQVRLSTYLKMKQAQYWAPGFGEMREHADVALATHLATVPGSTKPLPPKEIAKNKILRENSHLLEKLLQQEG